MREGMGSRQLGVGEELEWGADWRGRKAGASGKCVPSVAPGNKLNSPHLHVVRGKERLRDCASCSEEVDIA